MHKRMTVLPLALVLGITLSSCSTEPPESDLPPLEEITSQPEETNSPSDDTSDSAGPSDSATTKSSMSPPGTPDSPSSNPSTTSSSGQETKSSKSADDPTTKEPTKESSSSSSQGATDNNSSSTTTPEENTTTSTPDEPTRPSPTTEPSSSARATSPEPEEITNGATRTFAPDDRRTNAPTNDAEQRITNTISLPRLDVSAELVPMGVSPDDIVRPVESMSKVSLLTDSAAEAKRRKQAGLGRGLRELDDKYGATTITGHITFGGGKHGAFYALKDLKRGDKIITWDDKGQKRTWKMTQRLLPDKDALPGWVLNGQHSDRVLALVSCYGDWEVRHGSYSHQNNIIIIAEPVD